MRVRVPATSANLGPGFDALGLALGLHDDVTVRVSSAGLDVEVAGEGAGELPGDERNLLVRAMRAGFEAFGAVQPPGLAVSCVNRIPHGRGLGSSAAAIVAGVVAARALAGEGSAYDDPAVLRLAAEIEGHPDNVAACLLGGLTVAWSEPGGARAVRLPVAGWLAPVVFVPAERTPTAHARGVLPAAVAHADAAANAGRAALLVAALTGAAPGEVLLAASEDRLHQPYRAAGSPRTAALLDRLRAGGVPAVVSGAGPTLLALGPVPQAFSEPGWRVLNLPVDTVGATCAVG